MKDHKTALLIIVLVGLLAGCKHSVPMQQASDPLPIIVLPDVRNTSAPKRYVMLHLDYGLIISNGDTKSAPSYYLFCRDEKRIVKTHDVQVFLSELQKIPDHSKIDMVSKCTVPFYTQYGVNIDKEYQQVMDLLKQKQCILIESLEDDERHASFCYCEGGFTILDEYKSEQGVAPDADKPRR